MKNFTVRIASIVLVSVLFLSNMFAQGEYDASKFTPKSSIGFIENKGQMYDVAGKPVPYVYFRTTQRNVDFLITQFGLSYTFFNPIEEATIAEPGKISKPTVYEYARTLVYLEGATIHPENIIKENPIGDQVNNYYLAHCPRGILGVKTYSKVTIKEVYKGIDWILYATNEGIKYDFVVRPGADPNQIKIKYDGAADLSADANAGSVTIKNNLGEIREGQLLSYQKESNQQVNSKFLVRDNKISFWLGDYDHTQTLVIDPPVGWGTYFGTNGSGSGGGVGLSIAADADEVFVSGHSNDLPILPWAASGSTYNNGTVSGTVDVYIARFNHSAVQSWTTYFGGTSNTEEGWDLAIDPITNHITVVGEFVGSANFPTLTLAGAYNYTFATLYAITGFISEFDQNGVLYWSTHYGETVGGADLSATTHCRTVKFDNNGNLFVGGNTLSKNLNLNNGGGTPFYKGTHSDAADAVIDRQWDAFFLKFNASRAMTWGTLWGGADADYLSSINIDDNNNLLAIGNTISTDLASTSQLANPGGGAYYDASNSYVDAFVLRFNTSLQLTWGTYFGDESGWEHGYDIAADRNSKIYIVGYSMGGSSFPYKDLGSGAYYDNVASYRDAYIARFSSSYVQEWGTLYGGTGTSNNTGDDWFMGITTSTTNQVYIYGTTYSSSFPVSNAYQTTHGSTGVSRQDFCVVGFNDAGIRKFASYIGGNNNDYGYEGAIALKPGTDCFYWTGASNSTNAPTVNPGGGAYYQNTKAGSAYETVIYRWCAALGGTLFSQTNITCYNGSSGAATVQGFDGSAPYTYVWNPGGQTGATATGLTAGAYTVTITDGLGSTATVNVTITQPAAFTATTNVTNISCNGGNDGQATVTAGGGNGGLSYSWSAGTQTSTTATGLGVGTYTVIVTDALGCTKETTATITQPAALASTATVTQDVLCFGNSTGTANVSASGGTTNYTYSWSTIPPKTTASVTGLAANTYTVRVTDSKGCTVDKTIIITQPTSGLLASATATTNVLCYGNSTGVAGSTVSGGTTNYTYSWSAGAQTTANATGLANGTYTLTVTDANGCTMATTVSITQPASALTATTSITSVNCFGGNNGTASVTPSGGTTNYTYSWSAGAQTAATATGLTNGIYTVTITDNNGCTYATTANVTQPAAALTSSITINSNINCFGGNNGQLTPTVNGGTTTYTYAWSNGSSVANQNNLTAGGYTLTVTDNKGCTHQSNATITQPAILDIGIGSVSNVSCNGGTNASATATVTGGVTNYTYSWSGGGGTNPSIGNVGSGSYTVTVTDANGCTKQANLTFTQPTALTANTSIVSNVNCFGGNNGSASVVAGGGITNYTYSWSAGAQTAATATGLTNGTYTVTVTDNNGCTKTATAAITQPMAALTSSTSVVSDVDCFGNNTGSANASAVGGTSAYSYSWNTGVLTAGLSGVPQGTYTVTVTDNKGCTHQSTATITQPSAALTATTAVDQPTCNGGTNAWTSVTPAGGTTNYTYSWSNGVSTSMNSNIPAGTYTITVTDNNGCTYATTSVITEPTVINMSATPADATCNVNNGSATSTISGGMPGYTYLWSNSATTADINGVSAGAYTLTVTDTWLCSKSLAVNINNAGAPTALLAGSTNVACNSNNTGAADISVSGGTGTYTYAWTGPNGFTATTEDINNLPSGTYVVTVNDANNCISGITVNITQPSALAISVDNTTHVMCNSDSSGAIFSSVGGGVPGFNYNWSNGESTANIDSLPAGTYTLIVTDQNSCTASKTVTITQPVAPLAINASVTANIKCYGNAEGDVSVSAADGTPTYTYSWNNGSITATQSGLLAGTYAVLVTDNNGCTETASVTITGPNAALNVNITSYDDIACYSDTTGSAVSIAGNGTPGYTYSWSNGATTSSITGLTPGQYIVTTTDSNNCVASDTVTLSQPNFEVTIIDPLIAPSTCGNSNGYVSITNVIGGTPTYSYSWSNGSTDQDIDSLAAGQYILTTTDNNNCARIDTFNVADSPGPAIADSSFQFVNCFDDSTGSAGVTLFPNTGTGTITYTWSNGATGSPSINNIPEGVYTVIVSDANNCSTSRTFTITQPPMVLASSITDSVPIGCGGATPGMGVVSVIGGTLNYTYSWSNGMTNDTLLVFTDTVYTVTITDSNGCTSVQSVNITELPSDIIFRGVTVQNAKCFLDTGMITIIPFGGTPPYSYSWSNSSTNQFINEPAGTYTVHVNDLNGCGKDTAITITQPNDSLHIMASQQNSILCYSDSIGFVSIDSVAGGTPFYSYLWNTGDTTNTISNLGAGTYTVTVSDSLGCLTLRSFAITQPPAALTSNIDSSFNNVLCYGATTGSATVSTNGGTPSYTYSWNNGSTDTTISNIPAGLYVVAVTDANGCTSVDSVTIAEPPSAIDLTTNAYEVHCYGDRKGEAFAVAFGGTPSYTYSWNNGETTSSLSNLPAGTYTVTATDSLGCKVTKTVTVTQPSSPVDANFSLDDQEGVAPITVNITNNSTGGTYWNWVFGDSTSTGLQDPGNHTFNSAGEYDIWLTVIGAHPECRDSIKLTVLVHSSYTIDVPNVFTPNGDGTNDVFAINTTGVRDMRCVIYDRWGLIMYRLNGTKDTWDGRTLAGLQATDGTYYYILEVETFEEGEKFDYKGYIQLIR